MPSILPVIASEFVHTAPRTGRFRFCRPWQLWAVAFLFLIPSLARAQTGFQLVPSADRTAPFHPGQPDLQYAPFQTQPGGAGLFPETRWTNSRMLAMSPDPVAHVWSESYPYQYQRSHDRIDFDVTSPGGTASYGRMFSKGAVLIGGAELVLMASMLAMPKSFTGWHEDFLEVGVNNFVDAYQEAPSWDEDHWYHNYLGHPYAGSVYYNTVRCQGASPAQSFLFSTAMSVWWEYGVEAIAEHPSTQDLLVTPITGAILGEIVHQMTLAMKYGGASLMQKLIILVLNPTHAILVGF